MSETSVIFNEWPTFKVNDVWQLVGAEVAFEHWEGKNLNFHERFFPKGGFEILIKYVDMRATNPEEMKCLREIQVIVTKLMAVMATTPIYIQRFNDVNIIR